MFCVKIDWYLELSMTLSILTRAPVPAVEKQRLSMMLPPPCFTVGDEQCCLTTASFLPWSDQIITHFVLAEFRQKFFCTPLLMDTFRQRNPV